MKHKQHKRHHRHHTHRHNKEIHPLLIDHSLPGSQPHINQHQQKLNKLHQQIHPKQVPIPLTNTIIHPRTVMIKSQYTFLALMAVTHSWGLEDFTYAAVAVGDLSAGGVGFELEVVLLEVG